MSVKVGEVLLHIRRRNWGFVSPHKENYCHKKTLIDSKKFYNEYLYFRIKVLKWYSKSYNYIRFKCPFVYVLVCIKYQVTVEFLLSTNKEILCTVKVKKNGNNWETTLKPKL